jgi:ABC-type oligopeptide transport system ATPase subunit
MNGHVSRASILLGNQSPSGTLRRMTQPQREALLAPLLEVRDLRVHFPAKPAPVKAVDGVSFTVGERETVGLVGESGSGKTTIGKAILKLVPATGGQIYYRGREVLALCERDFRPLRKEMQMIFQDPFSSLNPRWTIGSIISEPLEIHFSHLNKSERLERVAGLLQKVALPADAMRRYPHEFSGGQRQRIGIARALAVEPKFIVCDEPVSALDVSVQAQIVNLLQDLQDELGLAYLFISHDLAVVQHISHRVLVMLRGELVEAATADEIYQNPQHEYTRKLLAAAA